MGDLVHILIESTRLNDMRTLIEAFSKTNEFLKVSKLNKFDDNSRSTAKIEDALQAEYTMRLAELREHLNAITRYWERERLDEMLQRELSAEAYTDLAY